MSDYRYYFKWTKFTLVNINIRLLSIYSFQCTKFSLCENCIRFAECRSVSTGNTGFFRNRMEMVRFELMTPCLQGRCSPNWATPPFESFSLSKRMGLNGLEPSTSRLSGVRSNQLSYKPILIWQPPTLPCRLQHSTIGRLSLNRRVRDENGCVP